MGAIDQAFPGLRDTKFNVKEEILNTMFYHGQALSIRNVRSVLKDRHKWKIGEQTILKFVNELIEEGRVEYVGTIPVEGFQVDGYILTAKESDVRRRSRATNVVYHARTVHGREGDGD